MQKLESVIERTILASRWLLLVFYVGLGALLLNIAVAAIATVIVGLVSPNRTSATAQS